MNDILMRKVAEYVAEIRSSKLSSTTLRKRLMDKWMPEIYSLIAKFMGEPPQEFTWRYHEAGESYEGTRHKGEYCQVEGLSPRAFYEHYVEPEFQIKRKVVLRHDPRDSTETNRTYAVQHFGGMVGGHPDISLAVDWDTFSLAAAKSILNDKPVWFAADVCKDFDPYRSLLSTEAYDYQSILGTTLGVPKKESIRTRISEPSHAMALVGVDLRDDDPNQVRKWKVENSWGECGQDDPGYLMMTQEWFQRYGFEVVVDLGLLDEETQQAYMKYECDPIYLPYNAPFGAVARQCSGCRSH
jgi:bleomycin hydrolase